MWTGLVYSTASKGRNVSSLYGIHIEMILAEGRIKHDYDGKLNQLDQNHDNKNWTLRKQKADEIVSLAKNCLIFALPAILIKSSSASLENSLDCFRDSIICSCSMTAY